MAALAEGLGIRAVARVFETDPNTVLRWLVEAAEHLDAFSRYFLRDVYVEQVQMDELFALLSAVKDGEVDVLPRHKCRGLPPPHPPRPSRARVTPRKIIGRLGIEPCAPNAYPSPGINAGVSRRFLMTEADAIKRLSRSTHWVWVAMDPVCKLILSADVGERTLAMAQHLVHQVAQVLAPECAPLFLTDGLREYVTALVGHYGQWIQPKRRQAKEPMPKPRWMPLPQLLYAQVIKSYRRRQIVGVKHRVVFGARDRIDQILAKWGWKINPLS